MKHITLLSKSYCCEELCDLERDVSEMLTFPHDTEYLKVLPDEHGFTEGNYRVEIVYIEEELTQKREGE